MRRLIAFALILTTLSACSNSCSTYETAAPVDSIESTDVEAAQDKKDVDNMQDLHEIQIPDEGDDQ